MAGSAWGQTLAELVPANSVFYVGWRGTANPGKGFAGSKLEAVTKDGQLGKFIDDTVPAMGKAAAQRFPAYAGPSQAATGIVRQLIREPSAIFFEMAGDRPHGGMLTRAGANTPKIKAALEEIARAIPAPIKPRVVTPGDSVGIVFGYDADEPVDGGLDQQPEFKKGLAYCVPDPETAAFINIKAGLDAIELVLAQNVSLENVDRYRRFVDASGFAGVKALTLADGFAGREWQSDAFLDAPMPRKGFFAVSPAESFDADLLKRVPMSSNTAGLMHFDASGSLQTLRDVAAATDPMAGDAVDKGIGAITMAIGKNLQNDLLASLGNQWAFYTAPEVGGPSFAGMVMVNKLANPLKAKQSIAAAAMFVTNTAHNALNSHNITVALKTIKSGDATVYYYATPFVAPAWTIKDGYLFVSMYPQTTIAAAKYAGKGFDELDAFKAAVTGDSAKPMAFSYFDIKPTLAEGYGGMLAVGRTVFGLSDMFLTATPEPILPPLAPMLAEATPVTDVSWADDAGLHSRTRTPWPGAAGMANFSLGNSLANSVPQMISGIMPAVMQAQQQMGQQAPPPPPAEVP
ncbi:MAG: hypothetical protein QM754_09100 [Tepidisphaeraceae bacterium]